MIPTMSKGPWAVLDDANGQRMVCLHLLSKRKTHFLFTQIHMIYPAMSMVVGHYLVRDLFHSIEPKRRVFHDLEARPLKID